MLFLDFLPQAIFNSFENHIFGVHRLFLCGCWNSLQRIVNAQILILDFAHSMIRQNIQRLQILQAADKVPQPAQKNVIQCNARHDNMPNPDRHLLFIQILRKFQNMLIALTGQFPMLCIINVLDIQHYQICSRH